MSVSHTFWVILLIPICFVLLRDTNASLEINSLLKPFDDTPPPERDPNETNDQLDFKKLLSTNNLEAMKKSYSEFPLLLRPYKGSGIIGSVTETIKNLVNFFGITSEEVGSSILNIKYPTDPFYTHIPEANFNSSQLLEQIFNYPVEEHTVQTKDGYILSLQRILTKTSKAPVVLILHGFLESSKIFLINSHANQNLPTIISDAGFDVWLANFRGSTYSQKHVNYSRDDPEFWRFSWNEQALIDLPTMIDFVLQQTDHGNLLPLFDLLHSVIPGLCSVSAFNAVLCQPIYSTSFSVRSRNINVDWKLTSCQPVWKITSRPSPSLDSSNDWDHLYDENISNGPLH